MKSTTGVGLLSPAGNSMSGYPVKPSVTKDMIISGGLNLKEKVYSFITRQSSKTFLLFLLYNTLTGRKRKEKFMYQVYIDKPSYFDPEMVGEFKDLDKAIELAEKEKALDSEATYIIEETNGSMNSYGEQISRVVKRG